MENDTVSSNFKRSKDPIQKKARDLFIPAYFVEPPNLDLFAALQNLMWYAVECLNALPSISGRNAMLTEHFMKCLALLAGKEKECASSLDHQARKLYLRFLEEAGKVESLLQGFMESSKSSPCPDIDLIPKSAAGDISAKATYLQWLAVCFAGESRIPFNPPDSDQPDRR
jgi:hypothetical protein